MGDVRLRELGLYDRGHHGRLQRLFRERRVRGSRAGERSRGRWRLSVSYAFIIFTAPILGAYADAHAAKKKLLAITTSGCVLGTALLSLGRARRSGARFRADRVVQRLLRHRREHRRGVLAGARAAAKRWARYRLGVGRWDTSAGCITLAVCLGYVIWARGRGYDGSAVRSGHDVDHGRRVCLGELVHVFAAQGARAAATGAKGRCPAGVDARRADAASRDSSTRICCASWAASRCTNPVCKR